MNDKIYKVFYQNDVLFLGNTYDCTKSSTINMMKSFDLYYFKDDYLQYRLKKNANIIDKKHKLKPYSEEIWVIKLFNCDRVKTIDWIDEKTFYKMRDQDRLDEILDE